jgi:DNA-binding PadR family transcriptional regulator
VESLRSKNSREFIKSIFSVPLRNLILHLIAIYGEMHGYEIMKKIEELTMNMWKPSTSTLYMILDNLVKEGLLERKIEYRGRIKRIKYRITEKGLDILSISTDTLLKIMYRIIERIEQVNKMLKNRKGKPKLLTREDIEKQIRILKKLREYIDNRINSLEKELENIKHRETP